MHTKHNLIVNIYTNIEFLKRFILFVTKVIYVKLKFVTNSRELLYILPHEGLGDLVAILPALNELSAKFKTIKIFIRRNAWEAVSSSFEIPANVKPAFFYHNKSYVFSKTREKIISRRTLFIKLGIYDRDLIFSYPNSFFYKLGIFDNACFRKNISLNKSNIQKLELGLFDQNYEYINLGTSNISFKHSINYRPCIESISHDELVLHHEDGTSNTIQIPNYPLLTNIMLAIRSKRAIVSDAGIFNILIRINECPKIQVYTRNPVHTHNKQIYKIPFDGQVHDYPK